MLTTSLLESFADFCAGEGLARDALIRSLRTDPGSRELLIGLETGRLPEREFELRMAAILGVSERDLIPRMLAGCRPDAIMLAAVRGARRAGIRTGLISNSWGTALYDRSLLAELFDVVVISAEVGIRKPAPEIYRLAAQRIGVPARACVFVDDLPFNLDPASRLGMATVHHDRAEETIKELERLLGVDLRQRRSRLGSGDE